MDSNNTIARIPDTDGPAPTELLNKVKKRLLAAGLFADRESFLNSFTQGRTGSLRQLTINEASNLLTSLKKPGSNWQATNSPQERKLFALAHDAGFVIMAAGKNDYARLHTWIEKHGHLAPQPLKGYKTTNDLSRLIWQLEKVVAARLRR